MSSQLGKLIRTLPDKCPDCGHKLQLRHIDEVSTQKGIGIAVNREIKQCPICEYEEDVKLEDKNK